MSMSDKMRFRTGDILTTVGAAIGVLAGIAMAIKAKVTIDPEMREVLFYRRSSSLPQRFCLCSERLSGAGSGRKKRELEAREAELLSGGSPPVGDERVKQWIDREELPEER